MSSQIGEGERRQGIEAAGRVKVPATVVRGKRYDPHTARTLENQLFIRNNNNATNMFNVNTLIPYLACNHTHYR